MEIPSELLAPEERQQRLAEAKRALKQAWVRYAVLELVVVVVPVGIAMALWAADAVPGWALAAVSALALVAIAGLMYDTVLRTVRPLEREIASLEARDDAS
jgi:membrane protein YdbS with pleckstrin-like domain